MMGNDKLYEYYRHLTFSFLDFSWNAFCCDVVPSIASGSWMASPTSFHYDMFPHVLGWVGRCWLVGGSGKRNGRSSPDP